MTAGRYARTCPHCGEYPAKVVVQVGLAPVCGVCAHRLGAARDLALRIRDARRAEGKVPA